ncbi:hypothetical protein AGMMS49949_07000 [Alphaproteobacteria bacterium]|nr:hypothetical protein AGMMS49949_07000 [Alphaproteobacteria bacterium]GHS97454.1 hypothetical protein AGMMS50296_4440 [Alphaproteobacteria bacterium]
MLFISVTPIRLWYSFAYGLYFLSLGLLLLTAVCGHIGMGAQRWIRLAFIQFQPSELMRISLILGLARIFHDAPLVDSFDIQNPSAPSFLQKLILPSFFVALPVLLTLEQPDLGTALLLLLSGGVLFFFAEVPWTFFASLAVLFSAALPFFWNFLLDYQKKRILTFFNPERDPLGSGYHIIQSKIAIGSGGFWGKGFLHGTQGALDFLPEKHTDFIFTLLSEEFGFLGVLVLLILYGLLIFFNMTLAFQARNTFRRLLILGMSLSFAFYALINIGMVVGVLPVVGIPLPLISYGGTSMVTLLISQGLIFSAAFYRTRWRKWTD